jgi:hypothetical protein
MFEKLVWQKDRMLMDGLVFRLQHSISDDWELNGDCFVFAKTRELVDQYDAFFSAHPNFRPQNVFELGLWDGGSLPFWFENLRPQKQVGIDLSKKQDSNYFRRYIADRGLADRVKAYWGVDQSDAKTLRTIVDRNFDGPLDLVIDDASHFYRQTKISFECLFPLLRPGGLYIIEDWAWEHWRDFDSPSHPWAQEEGLTDLVCELLQATGTSTTLIKSLTTYQGFTVVERGNAQIEGRESFRLSSHIWRRPIPS